MWLIWAGFVLFLPSYTGGLPFCPATVTPTLARVPWTHTAAWCVSVSRPLHQCSATDVSDHNYFVCVVFIIILKGLWRQTITSSICLSCSTHTLCVCVCGFGFVFFFSLTERKQQCSTTCCTMVVPARTTGILCRTFWARIGIMSSWSR